MHYFEVSKLWCIHDTLLDPRWCLVVFYTISLTIEHKKLKTRVAVLNALVWGTELAKHPFYTIGHKMMFGGVSEHFANLQHKKRCNTCLSGPNALCRGTEVAKMVSWQKHPFYSTGPKMRIESVFQHFRYLRNVKRCKTCVSGLNALFGVPKLQIWFCNQNIHSTPLDPKWLFGVFWSISKTLEK
jgi:hypothetical protein